MGIDVQSAEEGDIQAWNDRVSRSPQGTLFHLYESLELQATYAGATLHPLVGFKGEEPVGVFPLFEASKGPIRGAFSPPPDLRIPHLGPAMLNMGKLKQRKRDRRRQRFVEGCFDWVESEVAPRYGHIRTSGRYDDLRPFKWNDWSATPSYTYIVDLNGGAEELLGRFSSDARSNVRNADEDRYEITVGGGEAIESILEQVSNRYNSQGIAFDLPTEFAVDLYERLPDGHLKPYVCRVDGEFVGGMLILDFDDTVSRWQGGVRTDLDVGLPVNDLLDWRVMQDAIEAGRSAYDLVGAENQRINRYKAKFNPELESFYSAEYSELGVGVLSSLYKRFQGYK
ncbi:hypothetical protein C475_15628 [Halosimplex carlsbadense 2-9-1]|uniref:BioF2-like acetyltransferase domain-containing protein n=1 Tax=Halosimplex carlsbadense 2-9-1 TaxID=797114 RepID=M0CKA1_9EURY|nr:GNAT family N-acetyltransferase [Halosimplex carlsbadense]ELZ23715.1 hypothetical protein C475_15628 [Halosimplex carlsbadense 2-9-1]